MKKGFTLIEILVVVGILGILMAILVGGFSKAPKQAEKAKCQELVFNTATALTALFDENGIWPQALVKNHNSEQGLDAEAAYPLAKSGMSLTKDDSSRKLSGLDKFGVVSPWAQLVIKNRGPSASESDKVPSGGTIRDHRLRYALDLDGDGVIESVKVGGETVNIRATAAVWCCGADGKIEAYSRGQRKDDVYSWTDGQTRGVQ